MKKLTGSLALIVCTVSLEAQTSAEPAYPAVIRLTDSVACTAVKDQSQSPTCWAFGTNSLFESDHIKMNHTSVDLSEMFIARYAYIDKAKQYLATKGKTYFAGGGQFHDVIRVVSRYGIVPEEVYPGKPNGEYNHHHARLDSAMKDFVNGLLRQGKTEMNSIDLKHINDTLDRYLGKVPASFRYNMKEYTPKKFAEEAVQFVNDYIEVTAFADKPLYRKYILQDKFNWANDSFYNISLADLQMLVDTALARGWTVGWEGDVTERSFNWYAGFALLTNTIHDYDNERLANYKDESTERDHMLHIVGAGLDTNNKKWYYLKNSWGTWFSRYKGYMYMDESYFKLKTVIMMVNKAALPEQLKKKLGVK